MTWRGPHRSCLWDPLAPSLRARLAQALLCPVVLGGWLSSVPHSTEVELTLEHVNLIANHTRSSLPVPRILKRGVWLPKQVAQQSQMVNVHVVVGIFLSDFQGSGL